MVNSDLLFVYGTLDPSTNILEEMNIRYKIIGGGKVRAIKLNNMNYPSLVPSLGTIAASLFDGQLLQIEDAEQSFFKIDEYEEYYPDNESKSLYLRRTTDVYINNGIIRSHIYWFNFNNENLLKNSE